MELLITDNLLNTYGTCHGGALSALADMVMGIALRTLKVKVVTVELSMNYLQPVQLGQVLMATSSVIHQGRRTIVAETELHCQDNLVAKGKGTFFLWLGLIATKNSRAKKNLQLITKPGSVTARINIYVISVHKLALFVGPS